jgi:hypothetical protein
MAAENSRSPKNRFSPVRPSVSSIFSTVPEEATHIAVPWADSVSSTSSTPGTAFSSRRKASLRRASKSSLQPGGSGLSSHCSTVSITRCRVPPTKRARQSS